MLCPICNVDLMLAEKQGVEIDYCPKCRGVWLDRGELEKIAERMQQTEYGSDRREEYGYNREPKYDDHTKHHYHDKHYKKKSFFSDLLDF